MNQDELKAAIIEAGEDKKGVACRKEPCEAVEVAFRKVGEGLWFSGAIIGADRVDGVSPFNFGSDATVGLGTVVQIAGELSGGVVALLERDNRYGAAALLRQLVGAEYLTWAFVEDEDEAMRWMRSSREESCSLKPSSNARPSSRARAPSCIPPPNARAAPRAGGCADATLRDFDMTPTLLRRIGAVSATGLVDLAC